MQKYKIIKKLGRGGNGIVYEVEDLLGNRYAKKTLKNVNNQKAYQRFKDEISILSQTKSINGVISIIDYHFPVKISKNNCPYYIMPIGIPIKKYILNIKNDEILFKLLFNLCETINILHNKDITHRDIKPDNLLIINDQIFLSDFGLANFPKKKKISNPNESIGPKWTIAPEMKRISSKSAYKKADIYSLTKTIWMLITRHWFGFEGQYIPNSNISLDKFITMTINKTHVIDGWYYFSVVLLEKLLIQGTDNNPEKRPEIQEFINSLTLWYNSNNNWHKRNKYEWEDALKVVFPISIPESAKWNNIKHIFDVLKILFEKYDNLNHCFYPNGGGNDFNHVEMHPSKKYLIIDHNLLILPNELKFEFNNDFDYSYFILSILPNKALSQQIGRNDEEDIFINEFGHLSQSNLEGYRSVKKYTKGRFLIAKKTSIINQLKGELDAYGGIHNQMYDDEYKELIQKIQKKVKAHKSE